MNETYSELLPEDAGEHSEGLLEILRRIPDGWGRWISCSSGWYPLLIELDEKLAEIAPEYEVHQVKEKFGTLRYYIGMPELAEHQERELELERERRRGLFNQMYEIINAYEHKSATICESCGSTAELRSRGYWYQTLCSTCADRNGYQPIVEEGKE
jgi:hypothetical protein